MTIFSRLSSLEVAGLAVTGIVLVLLTLAWFYLSRKQPWEEQQDEIVREALERMEQRDQ